MFLLCENFKCKNRRCYGQQRIVYLRHLSLMLWTRAHCFKRKGENCEGGGQKAYGTMTGAIHMQLTSMESPLLPLGPCGTRKERMRNRAGGRDRQPEGTAPPPLQKYDRGSKGGPRLTLIIFRLSL